jgi:PAS domain S-box-containing protein
MEEIPEDQRAEQALHRLTAYNRSLIEASLDPLATVSPDGKITDVNSATERVTGFSRQELVGTDISDYFTQPEKARAGYQLVFREGQVQDYELEIRHRDGRLTPVVYNASVYRDEAGAVVGVFAAARDITERKRAEEAVRRASAYNRSLIEASLDPLVTISPDGKITDVNSATERVTGFSRQELVGTDFSDYFTQPEKARAGYQLVFREGQVQDYELEIRHRDGRLTPVFYNASVYRDESGAVVGVFAAARDVTERKRAEEASSYLASIVESSDDAIIGRSLDGIVMSWNPGAESLYGYSAQEMIGRPFSLVTPPDRPDEELGILEKIKLGERIEHLETTRVRKDGERREVSVTVSPIKDVTGKVIGASAISRDISQRKQAERALLRAGAYNRSLIEASLDPLVTISPDGKITDVNSATERVTGFSRQELIGTDFADYFTQPEKARAGYQQVFREGQVQEYELEIRHRNGRLTPVVYNASIYRDEAGAVVGVFAAARDITARKRAEEAVRKSEANLNRAQEIAHVGSWQLDVTRNRLAWSDEVFRIFGMSGGTPLT